jgi:hypothetical protein
VLPRIQKRLKRIMNRLFLRYLFLSALALFFVSCASVPVSGIVEDGNYEWENKKFSINSEKDVFSASGEVTMWVDDARYKGKFNGDYEAFSASPYKWRIIITGPFNISVATVIINGLDAHIFHDGMWESKPWHIISNGLFNSYVDGNLFSVMLGGRFNFSGQCASVGRGTDLCRMSDIYYLIHNGKVREVKSGELYAVYEEGKWVGVKNDKHAFIFSNKKVEKMENISESLFTLPTDDEEDEFDAL